MFFFDYDLDGWTDIFAANGHIEEEIGRVQPKVQYRQPPLLFRNLGSRRFEDASGAVGKDFTRPIVARGAAYADYDHDGDLDVAVTTNHGPAYLFRNDGGNRNNWLAVQTRGVEVEPRRHRRHRPGGKRRRTPVADGPQRIELCVTKRADPDLRSRRRRGCIVDRGRVAQRRSRSDR